MLDLTKINVLADICTNHRGNQEMMLKLLADIKAAGAIPKVQLFSRETFPHEWLPLLPPEGFVASVFQPVDVATVLSFKPLALKIASVEATYMELVGACLTTDLPVIISTGGMSEDEFIQLAESTLDSHFRMCFMHCVSEYPTPIEHANLERLSIMAEILDDLDSAAELGYSCHTPGWAGTFSSMAMALGATQFEVHLRTAFAASTTDEKCALDDLDLCMLVDNLNQAYHALGYDGPGFSGTDRAAVLDWRKRWQK